MIEFCYRDPAEQKVIIGNECPYGEETECAGGEKRERQSSSQETDKAGVASVFYPNQQYLKLLTIYHAILIKRRILSILSRV